MTHCQGAECRARRSRVVWERIGQPVCGCMCGQCREIGAPLREGQDVAKKKKDTRDSFESAKLTTGEFNEP